MVAAAPPEKLPEQGYYYHYKHDPNGPVNNYAYFIYGAGHHTEDPCPIDDTHMLVYRPLYEEAYVYRNGMMFDLRPLRMFYEKAEKNGEKIERFVKITDRAIITRLREIKKSMYPPEE